MIRSLMGAGQGIYLHPGHNLDGRAAIILACLLIDQGQIAQHANLQVGDFWLQALPYLIRLPLSE